ncbi:bifunctional tetrahydrofolate synthase/dihydrofolate synthase [Nitrincola tibetensis]|uniref:Dihydrofolate synthase/folylpolyglutamate synthase n=1 Tax=Nitrincola tibetensis TaxID=2219697 RepID=A0A364NIY0_9GAMM|nr:bifunctional tetrahydrofolate synthase/dihydrofolate synthase [Nitrincola tibetensis]RAU17013.1 bifunctional tetrahydrofolate synthase/dihydrofolate synthase [Nitrincola tibetensis]
MAGVGSSTWGLAQWLEYIESCHPGEIDLGLDRVSQVATKLEINLNKSFVFTVGGTNGKGTTTRLLESVFSAAGLVVATYTSPHFQHYNERIRLAGQDISDQDLCRCFAQIEAKRSDIPLTYFEYGTLAALLFFTQTAPDVAVLEVGLGGRLDAINIIDADISIVTTVSMDHMDWLGDTRDAIGFEKAGIFRSEKPAICGDLDPPQTLIDHAQSIGSHLYLRNVDFSIFEKDESWDWKGRNQQGETLEFFDLGMPSVPLQNAATAIQAILLSPFCVTEAHMRSGLSNASLTGRMQMLKLNQSQCILDVAHNPESAAYLNSALSKLPPKQTHIVLGMLADKDIGQVLQTFSLEVEHWHLVSLNTPRGATATQLQAFFKDYAPNHLDKITLYSDVSSALTYLAQQLSEQDRVVVAGSFYTVTDALTYLTSP